MTKDPVLTTINQVLEALGGPTAVGRMTKRIPQQFVQARHRNRFPAPTYLIMIRALGERGKTALPSLWGIEDPDLIETLEDQSANSGGNGS